MRAVLYARVSSAAQRDRHTIASQLRTLPEFVAARGWKLVQPPGHYVDDGRTAKAGHLEAREAFQRLLADASSGAFDVVVVVDLDRLTRSEDLTERGAVLGTFQRARVSIAISSSGQVLDLSSSMGDLYSGLQAFFAAEENRKRRERTVRGKIEAAHKGRKPAGRTLFGYTYDRVTGAWGIDPVAAPIAVECFERVAAGESCYRVCIDFQDRGLFRPRGGQWCRTRVHTLVKNRAYTGTYVVDKARGLAVTIPRLVSDELFAAAHAMLPGIRRPRAPRSQNWNLIEGIARCGECGERIGITGTPMNKHGIRRRYYVCATQKVPPRDRVLPRCGNRLRQVEELDTAVWAALCRRINESELASEAVAARRDAEAGHDWKAELDSYQRQLVALERREAAILERFRRGLVSEGAMDIEARAAARQRDLLVRNRDLAAQELARAQRSSAETDALEATLEGLRARVATATPRERQELARLLVPGRGGLQVTIWRDRIEVAGHFIGGTKSVVQADAADCRSVRLDDQLFRIVLS